MWGVDKPKKIIIDDNRYSSKNSFFVYNATLKQWEEVSQKDYLNSFDNYAATIDEIIKNENKAKSNVVSHVESEITRLQNELNIVEEEDPDKVKIRKFYKYIKELENEKKEEN